MIFAAGYTLKKKNFIRNLNYILALGVFGTILAMTIISVIMYYGNQYYYEKYLEPKGLPIWIEPSEVLLIASVLCSTDTVAVVTLITPDKYQTLNSVLFGEGVVNDAVAILLFRTISNIIKEQSQVVENIETTDD